MAFKILLYVITEKNLNVHHLNVIENVLVCFHLTPVKNFIPVLSILTIFHT